mmetsp:Transcript_12847/g.30179  ORF Transcript_12847/g.30179 Transcript_12847/m.30179 type:complete len:331 (+) Transcript_12847:416-1408(+)
MDDTRAKEPVKRRRSRVAPEAQVRAVRHVLVVESVEERRGGRNQLAAGHEGQEAEAVVVVFKKRRLRHVVPAEQGPRIMESGGAHDHAKLAPLPAHEAGHAVDAPLQRQRRATDGLDARPPPPHQAHEHIDTDRDHVKEPNRLHELAERLPELGAAQHENRDVPSVCTQRKQERHHRRDHARLRGTDKVTIDDVVARRRGSVHDVLRRWAGKIRPIEVGRGSGAPEVLGVARARRRAVRERRPRREIVAAGARHRGRGRRGCLAGVRRHAVWPAHVVRVCIEELLGGHAQEVRWRGHGHVVRATPRREKEPQNRSQPVHLLKVVREYRFA